MPNILARRVVSNSTHAGSPFEKTSAGSRLRKHISGQPLDKPCITCLATLEVPAGNRMTYRVSDNRLFPTAAILEHSQSERTLWCDRTDAPRCLCRPKASRCKWQAQQYMSNTPCATHKATLCTHNNMDTTPPVRRARTTTWIQHAPWPISIPGPCKAALRAMPAPAQAITKRP